MIDWWSLAFNALWIFGASILFAASSYHQWLAGETGRTLRQVVRQPWPRMFYLIGATLVCVGWTLGQADRWWERLLWGLLAALFVWQVFEALRAGRNRC